MPRTMQEIIDHAEELAAKYERLEPDQVEWDDAADLRDLRNVAVHRAEIEQAAIAAVAASRAAGRSWALIGSMLGTSASAAQQRYGRPAEDGPMPLIITVPAKAEPNRRTFGKAPGPVERTGRKAAAPKKQPVMKRAAAKKSTPRIKAKKV